MSTSRWREWAQPCGTCTAVCLGYGVFFTLVFLPGITQGLLAPADGIDNYYPSLLSGDKGWTPYLFCGFPTFADPQEMVGYPPAWLLLRTLGSWNVFVIAGYTLAAAGMHLALRYYTGSHAAALIGAVSYSLGGFLVGHLRHVTIVHTAAWFPWILLAILTLARVRLPGLRATARSAGDAGAAIAGLAAATAALMLAGHPQIQLYALTFAGALTLILAPRVGRDFPDRSATRFLLQVGVGVVLGILLYSVQLLPLLELTGEAVRQQLTFEDFGAYALPAAQLPMLVAPLSSGQPLHGYHGAWSFEELSGYVGLLPWVLVIAWGTTRPRGRVFWWAVLLAAVGTTLALGNAFIGAALFHIPLFDKFRAPGRHLFEFSAGLSVAAGIAFAQLRALPVAQRRRALAMGAGITLVVVLGALAVVGSARPAASGTRTSMLLTTWLPLLLVTLVGLLTYWWSARPDRWRSAALVAFVVADMTGSAYFHEWRHPVGVEQAQPTPLVTALREKLGSTGQRYTPLLGTRQPGADGTPNRTRLWQLPSTSGFNPLRLRHYVDLTGIDLAGVVQLQTLAAEDRALDIFASRYLVLPQLLLERWSPPVHFRRTKEFELATTSAVFENTRALPRAWLVYDALVLSDDDAILAIKTSQLPPSAGGRTFRPEQQAIVSEPLPNPLGPVDTSARVDIVEFEGEALQDGALRLQVKTSTPALLVLSDVYYPGWTATIGDAPHTVVRTNHALRGVVVPAGDHSVKLRFEPRSRALGRGLTGAALAVVVALLVSALVLRARRIAAWK